MTPLILVAFIAVFVAGGIIGFLACGVLVAAGSADRHGEFLREMRLREEREGDEKQP